MQTTQIKPAFRANVKFSVGMSTEKIYIAQYIEQNIAQYIEHQYCLKLNKS